MHRFALALVLAMSAAGPTAANDAAKAPAPEDRYLWLEDVTGEKALDWARARNAESAKVLETGDFAALEKRILAILDSDDRIPYVEKLGHWYYNFWRDAKNPRGLWRRTTLAEYRKDAAGLGDGARPRRARQRPRTRTGSGTAPTACKPGVPALPRPALARRRRRRRRARVRPRGEGVRARTASPCPRPRAAWAGATPTPSTSAPTSAPARMTDLRLPADRQGVEARHAARGGRDGLRGQGRGHLRSPRSATTPRASSATSSTAASPSTRTRCSCAATASSSRSTSPTARTPASTATWLLLELRDDWTVGGKTYPAGALLAATSRASWRASGASTCSSSPPTRKSLAGFSPTLNHVLRQRARQRPQPRLRAHPRRPGRGRASRCPACRSSARSARARWTTRSPTTTS